MVLKHKIICIQIDLEATQMFEFSRGPGLKRSPIRLILQTGRTRGIRNSFEYRVGMHRNRLPLAAASVPEQRAFINLLIILLSSIFAPAYALGNVSLSDQLICTHQTLNLLFISLPPVLICRWPIAIWAYCVISKGE